MFETDQIIFPVKFIHRKNDAILFSFYLCKTNSNGDEHKVKNLKTLPRNVSPFGTSYFHVSRRIIGLLETGRIKSARKDKTERKRKRRRKEKEGKRKWRRKKKRNFSFLINSFAIRSIDKDVPSGQFLVPVS